METSTKLILAGLAAAGVVYYVKTRPQTSGPALPKTTPSMTPPSPVAALPAGSQPISNSPEVQAVMNSLPSQFPNSPEVQAAVSAVQNAPVGSPEFQSALNILQGLPASPEVQAALNSFPTSSGIVQPRLQSAINPDQGPVITDGDVVNVDMFRSGMNLPQNLPLVGLIFMNVDSLAAPGDPTKFLGSFVSPEFRVLGQQVVNRSAIVEKV